MTIPQQFKEELRNRLRLSEVIGRRVKVTRAGQEYKACCPFHHEKTPSFTINDQKQFYHCFGCGAHGDVITFTMEHDNLPFMEALEALASEAGMSVPKPTPEARAQYKLQDRLYAVCQEATKWFAEQLQHPKHKDVMGYALRRGLSPEIITQFRIGFAPNDMASSNDGLRKAMLDKGFTDKEMIEACLTKPSKKGTEPYSFFRERLMFPVTDGRGRVVAFGGRILPDEMRTPDRGDFKPPKYMNSSDTPLFHKGRMVFNESIARGAAGKDDAPVIVAEGYTDVLALVQAGFAGAVAPLGTAMTEDQISLCWSMIPGNLKEPYICFDGDNAGQRAAERAIERMLPMIGPGQSARFIFMPTGEDPDSLIKKHGTTGFQKYLNEAQPLIDVLWQTLIEGQQFDTPERLAGLEKAINIKCSQISDETVAYHYRTRLREKMREAFPSRKPWQPNRAWNKNGKKQSASVAISLPSDRNSVMQIALLYAFYKAPEMIAVFEDQLGCLDIGLPDLAKAREMLMDAYADGASDNTAQLVQHLNKKNETETLFTQMGEQAGLHVAFLNDVNDLGTIEKGIKQLLQNLLQRGNYTSLGASARALLDNKIETTQ